MRSKQKIYSSGAAFALAGGIALVLPAAASAVPFDNQPSPMGCADGMGTVFAVEHAEQAVVPGGEQYYAIGEPGGGAGAHVNWLNLNTFAGGGAPLLPANFGTVAIPQALGKTGAGQVVTVVHGAYINSKNQTCVMIPGFDVSTVPEPDPAPAPAK